MNKTSYFTLLIILTIVSITSSSIAQIPTGYYDTANGLTGGDLKLALHNIIKGHTEFPYTSSSTDTWDILKEADKDPANAANVLGIYSAFSMNAALEYDNAAGWNREHVWAKSRGDFGTSQGAGTDVHHLRAADVSTNSARSNRNFDNADTQYIDGSGNYSGPTDSYTSSTAFIWEPRDEMKGDVARMIFYMATRYEGDTGEPDLELTEDYLTNTDKSPLHAKLSTLIEWHLADPVSSEEQTRNDIVYSYQNNRNPYIDHPEYVCQIYTCPGSNTAPVFTSNPVLIATEDEVYNYDITTSDADGDQMNITAPVLPTWLTLTPDGSGESNLSGIPSSANTGDQAVELNVSDGTDNNSQSFTIVVSVVTSVGNLEELSDTIDIYPNPTSGVVNLEVGIKQGEFVYLEVHDLRGQLAFSLKIKVKNGKIKRRIDLSGLSNGFYTIKLHNNSGYEYSKKISIKK